MCVFDVCLCVLAGISRHYAGSPLHSSTASTEHSDSGKTWKFTYTLLKAVKKNR